jgi:hypothetical protein
MKKNLKVNTDYFFKEIAKLREVFSAHIFEIVVFSVYFFYLFYLRIIGPILVLDPEFPSDSGFYLKMGEDITCIFRNGVIAPFCYRILYPFLAGLLPFNIHFNFALIGFISIYLTGLMVYYTLRIKFDKIFSFLGFFLFWFFFFIYSKQSIMRFYIWIPYLVDPLAIFFFMCCFYGIFSANDRLYCISLILGILTKESVIFTIPVFLMYHIQIDNNSRSKREKTTRLMKKLKFILPGIITFILLRVFIIPEPIANYYLWTIAYKGNEYSLGMILVILELRLEQLSLNFILEVTLGIWVFFLVLAFMNSLQTWTRWIKCYGIFWIFTYCQLFIAIAIERNILIGFYPMIYLSISGIYGLFHPNMNYLLNMEDYTIKYEDHNHNT